MDWLETLKANWFTLLQTISIVFSLIFTGVSFLIDARSRKVSHLADFTKQHREIWREVREKPALARVLDPNVNLTHSPLTFEEERFVHSLVLHLNVTLQAIEAGLFEAPEMLHNDVKEFFLLPIPNQVWKRIKDYQNDSFVVFVDSLIDKS